MTNLMKYVDGQPVECSPEESEQIRAMWAMNERHPEFSNAVAYDGVHSPTYDLSALRSVFTHLLNQARDAGIKDLNQQIDLAQENGQDTAALYQQRKTIREAANVDCSACQEPDELLALIPPSLQSYWQKTANTGPKK